MRHFFIDKPVPIFPLALFRILFGLMMLVSLIRFAAKGWIAELYIAPQYYFTFYGFDWVQPLGETGMYVLFFTMGLAALGIMLGCFYRLSAVVFFLAFTYVELIDKTNYLNHYYFVSLMAFLLICLPAHRSLSLDVLRKPALWRSEVPAWTIHTLKLQLGVVYVFAGIAKLHPEWLFEAMPLRIWLPAQSHLPIIGPWLEYEWVAYAFSWLGAFYDLFIVFFLLHRKTRPWAYLTVIAFHLMTGMLFQIGMFPYIMLALTTIFFQEELLKFKFKLKFNNKVVIPNRREGSKKTVNSWIGIPSRFLASLEMTGWASKSGGRYLLLAFFLLQLLLPFRYLLYPGNLFWNEQGYRFSWRVMLMEKSGSVNFHVYDPVSGQEEWVSNYEYLRPIQEKMMSTQPDMILQFAHYLGEEYQQKGFVEPEVRAEAYVSLNGRRSQPLVDPEVNLLAKRRGWHHKDWVLPFSETKRN